MIEYFMFELYFVEDISKSKTLDIILYVFKIHRVIVKIINIFETV